MYLHVWDSKCWKKELVNTRAKQSEIPFARPLSLSLYLSLSRMIIWNGSAKQQSPSPGPAFNNAIIVLLKVANVQVPWKLPKAKLSFLSGPDRIVRAFCA
jgi:hypothetical protein